MSTCGKHFFPCGKQVDINFSTTMRKLRNPLVMPFVGSAHLHSRWKGKPPPAVGDDPTSLRPQAMRLAQEEKQLACQLEGAKSKEAAAQEHLASLGRRPPLAPES